MSAITPKIALGVRCAPNILDATPYLAAERLSAYELAERKDPAVKPGTPCEANVELPKDISFAIGRWLSLKVRRNLERVW